MKILIFALFSAFALPAGLAGAEGDPAGAGDAEKAEASSGSALDRLTMITDKFGIEGPTLVAQMINFAIVAFVLYRFAVKPVAATLEERQQKISDGLQYAEEMKNQLAQAERERSEKIKEAATEAQRIMNEARDQSKEVLEQKTREATAQAEAMIRKARESTEQERRKMLSEVRREVARLVVATSSKVLDRELSDSEKSRFSEAAAQELAGAGKN